jgi:cell division protein DivIC
LDKTKIIILSILVAVILVIIFIPGYLKIKKLVRQNKELESQIVQIKQRNLRLKEEQKRLISDPIYLEKVAREKLGVVRKGEELYRVLPPQENQ